MVPLPRVIEIGAAMIPIPGPADAVADSCEHKGETESFSSTCSRPARCAGERESGALTMLKARTIQACVGVGDTSPDRGELLGDDVVDPVSWNFISFSGSGDTEDTWCSAELPLSFTPFTTLFVSYKAEISKWEEQKRM